MPLVKKLDRYTYKDYKQWPSNERWELIEGVPYDMTPAPSTDHQRISHVLNGIFYNFLTTKKSQTFAAPFDVRLKSDDEPDDSIKTVVQPDISVICDLSKLDKNGCLGNPDLIVEILSESTAYKDETEKLCLYEKHGVKEYWIVNPEAQYIMIYHHNGISFNKPTYLVKDDLLTSSVLAGLEIDLKEIFKTEENILPA